LLEIRLDSDVAAVVRPWTSQEGTPATSSTVLRPRLRDMTQYWHIIEIALRMCGLDGELIIMNNIRKSNNE